ncbi:hypothetical protein [Pedobacter hartonius]|uniref:Uncharacterized protein n=1 Tax=Pedobacter hartonius TaxID=425514 RepID=A0A1H3WPW1_9SPHI|nr:hypothetical protein [Pedobacter hartonius]SDZ88990.1 hypothetical protein SAMN05443550_101340 [Pedobacter hartonius]
MKKTSFSGKISTALICFTLATSLSSCSKKNDDSGIPETAKGKNVKLTVSVTGAPDLTASLS